MKAAGLWEKININQRLFIVINLAQCSNLISPQSAMCQVQLQDPSGSRHTVNLRILQFHRYASDKKRIPKTNGCKVKHQHVVTMQLTCLHHLYNHQSPLTPVQAQTT